MNVTDEYIIKGCLNGDPKAQRALYEKYKVSMFRLCLRYANDQMEAEDILQEGFINVFRDLKQFSFSGALGGWIRRVIVNVALQHIRKKKRLFPTVELDHAMMEVSHLNTTLAQLNAEALTIMVQKLPPGYRAVFNMYVIEGYNHKEISEQMEITIGTSKSQLSKAKAMLRQQLKALDQQEARSIRSIGL